MRFPVTGKKNELKKQGSCSSLHAYGKKGEDPMVEKNLTAAESRNRQKIRRIEREAGAALHDCYQCGKCTAGCPMAQNMDLMPRQVIRYLQLGLYDEAVNSKAPWVCATCSTCSARCPHEVKIAEIMEAVRQEAAREGIHPIRNADLFTNFFMVPLKFFGKNHEMTLTALYNLTSGNLFQHFSYLPGMLRGGKLRIIPEMVKDRAAVHRIIDNCEREAMRR